MDLDELMRMPDDERTAFLDDRANWAASNPALGRGRVDEESILRNRRAMRDEDFAREILGIWPVAPEEGGRVIRSPDWDALADPSSAFEGSPLFAIDCSPGGLWCAVGAGGRRTDRVPHVELAEHRMGIGWLPEWARDRHEKHEPVAWLLDPGGPAGALVQPLEAVGVPLTFVTGREYAGACGAFVSAVVEKAMRHLGGRVLGQAVAAGRKRDVGDGGWAWGRKNSEVNIAPLVTVTLVHHGVAGMADPLDNIW